MLKMILAIAIGSATGGVFRWFLSLKLNVFSFSIPLGTLIANLIAGYVIGFAMAFFNNCQLSPEWRLLIITGFCGGLSTFSTFSAEIVGFLQQGRFGLAFATVAIHVLGCIIMTFLGILTYQLLKG